MRVLPQRDELERRLVETVGAAAAARICTRMGPTNADAQFFAADVGVLLPAQLEEATAPPVKRPRANAGMFSTRHRLLARCEADEDRLRRQILLEKKRLSRESGVLRVDPTHSIERALEMVEVLPQGTSSERVAWVVSMIFPCSPSCSGYAFVRRILTERFPRPPNCFPL